MSKRKKTKTEVLIQIKDLATEYQLRIQDINATLKPEQSETLMKLFAYLGGIFIFSGLSIYIGTFWGTTNPAMRITLTFGTGIALYLLAVLLPSYRPKSETMLTPLFLSACFFQTIGLFVAMNEFKDGVNFKIAAPLIFGVMLIQQLGTFWKIKRPSLIFTALFFWSAFLVSTLDLLRANEKIIGICTGLSLLGIAYFLDRRQYKSLASFWYFIGAIVFLNGLFDALRNTWFEILFFGAGGLMLYLSTLLRNRSLLFVSTLSALGYIGYFSSKHFMHSAAWPILLVLSGLVCFGVGVMVLKLSKKYMI